MSPLHLGHCLGGVGRARRSLHVVLYHNAALSVQSAFRILFAMAPSRKGRRDSGSMEKIVFIPDISGSSWRSMFNWSLQGLQNLLTGLSRLASEHVSKGP